ncbi:DLW-39 family protein [Actinopolymorpha alba]|nr:DLW-39 family protein [Actinopolymorpha alba]
MAKKALLAALVILGGWLAYRRLQSEKAGQDLWAEATDPVPPSGVLH